MGSEPVPFNYLPIIIFMVLGALFGIGSLVVGWVVRPSRPYRAKLLPYESGSPLFMDARVQFPMRYYIIAMLFVIFDIDLAFLFPWAVVFRDVGITAFYSMLVFIGILALTLWYVWKKGALEWE